MLSQKKAYAQSAAIAEKLTLRLAASAGLNSVRKDKDANNWPLLVISNNGTETSGAPVCVIRIQSQNAISTDVFGNNLVAFNPQITQVYSQTGESLAKADLAVIMYEVTRHSDIIQSLTTQSGQTVQSQIDNAATTLDVEIYELR